VKRRRRMLQECRQIHQHGHRDHGRARSRRPSCRERAHGVIGPGDQQLGPIHAAMPAHQLDGCGSIARRVAETKASRRTAFFTDYFGALMPTRPRRVAGIPLPSTSSRQNPSNGGETCPQPMSGAPSQISSKSQSANGTDTRAAVRVVPATCGPSKRQKHQRDATTDDFAERDSACSAGIIDVPSREQSSLTRRRRPERGHRAAASAVIPTHRAPHKRRVEGRVAKRLSVG
jgi:hypothetical protein